MTNYVSKLFDKMREKGMEPLSALETLATNAEESGFIDGRMHRVLQDLIPFPGFQRRSIKAVSRRFNLTIDEAKRLEESAYGGLINYVNTFDGNSPIVSQKPRHPTADTEVKLDGDLYELPFQECSDSTRVINALNAHFRRSLSFERNPTPKEVLDLIMAKAKDGTKFHVRGFGRAGYRMLADAYSRIGIEMPQFDPIYKRFYR